MVNKKRLLISEANYIGVFMTGSINSATVPLNQPIVQNVQVADQQPINQQVQEVVQSNTLENGLPEQGIQQQSAQQQSAQQQSAQQQSAQQQSAINASKEPQMVDAKTYIAQLPSPNQQILIPTPTINVQQEVTQQPKPNKFEAVIDFIKSDKCALWAGGILSTIALLVYAFAPKSTPKPGIFQKLKMFFSGLKISFPKITDLPIVKSFQNFVHNTR